MNEEDANIHPNLSGNFNIESGLWEYPALSQQKPRKIMKPEFVNFTLERNEMIASKKLNSSTGLYSSYICKPSPVQEDGSAKTCNCGNVYITDSALIEKGTLYTRMAPVEIEYHHTVCSAEQCSIHFTKGAEEKSIFLKTSLTAAGDEIGWDFVKCVRKTRCSFTAFCNEMTRRYQTTNIWLVHS